MGYFLQATVNCPQLVMAHEDHCITMRESGNNEHEPIYLRGHKDTITAMLYSDSGAQVVGGWGRGG